MEPENDELDPAQDAVAVEPREPWEKKVDESQRAYHAFSLFRDSEKRSLKAVAASLSCSTQNVFWWSTRHNWRLRADAYDLHVAREQRVEFARNSVRMRERHLAVAQAMLNVAAHSLREWQSKIASGSALNLAPEQTALLVKCATELEARTIGVDGEHRPTTINVVVSTHRYDDEKAGSSGVIGDAEGDVELLPWREAEALAYERMTPAERKALDTWKTPPKKRLN
jgi:hypothetical protein